MLVSASRSRALGSATTEDGGGVAPVGSSTLGQVGIGSTAAVPASVACTEAAVVAEDVVHKRCELCDKARPIFGTSLPALPFQHPPAPTNGRITSGVCTGLPDTEARRRWCSGDAATSTFFSALCRGHSAFVSSSSLPRIHPLNGPCPHRLCQDDRWLGQHERVEEGPPHRTPPCSSF